MKKFKIERIYPMTGEWMHFNLSLVVDEDEAQKKVKIKTRSGGWAMVKKTRTKFWISFDGKRFSDSEGLKALEKKFSPNVVRYQLSKCRKIYAEYMAINPDAE